MKKKKVVKKADYEFTTIGKYKIPIRKHHFASIVSFHSGKWGKQERGDFAFWTAVLRKVKGKKQRAIFGRAWLTRDPGERMRRIGKEQFTARSKESRAAYKEHWDLLGGGKNVEYIRPSTYAEVCSWMVGHMSDARHAYRICVNGGTKYI